MNINKQRRIFKNEINPGSMADIGFLLLIFFLVSTTINTDKGILVKLPPIDQNSKVAKIADRNLCKILVNKENKLLVRGQEMPSDKLTEYLKEFILNPSQNPIHSMSANKAVISLQNDRATSYATYIDIYNKIKKAYNQLREQQAQMLYEKSYLSCNKSQKNTIIQMIPMIISEADPVDLSF